MKWGEGVGGGRCGRRFGGGGEGKIGGRDTESESRSGAPGTEGTEL